MFGGARPPPPPPAAPTVPLAQRFQALPVPVPVKKMKQLFWDVVPLPRLENTFWVQPFERPRKRRRKAPRAEPSEPAFPLPDFAADEVGAAGAPSSAAAAPGAPAAPGTDAGGATDSGRGSGEWEEVEEPLLDFGFIEDSFAQVVKAPKAPGAGGGPGGKGGGAKAQTAIIDSKRAYNINILMGSKIKIPIDQLRAAVVSLDPRAFASEEAVAALLRCVPSAEDAAGLQVRATPMCCSYVRYPVCLGGRVLRV